MSSVAIWSSPKVPGAKLTCPIEVHFNIWRLRNKRLRRIEQFLDIGLMIENSSNMDSLNLYLPFAVKERIRDLGKSLETTSAIQAVFNEPWCAVVDPGKSTIQVMDFDKKDIFQIYKLNDKDIEVTSVYGGSLLRLLVPDTLQTKTYFRFRICVPDLWPITKEDKPSNSWLESAFFVSEIVDFHLNEKRNLSEELLRAMHEGCAVSFTKTHLFLMRYNNYDHIFSHPFPVDTRTLEQTVWTEYISADYAGERILAYHWRQKIERKASVNSVAVSKASESSPEGFSSFNVFAKFRFQKANKSTILIFLVGILAISIIGGLIANCIYNTFWG